MTASINSYSLPVRRFAAVGLLLASLFALAAYVIEPLARRVAGLGAEITAQREVLGRLTFPAQVGTQVGAPTETGIGLADVDLPGETEPIQLANLQAAIRRIAGEEGVRLLSTRSLPPQSPPTTLRDALPLAGLQLSLQAPIEAVQRLLHRLEAQRPMLIIDGLELVPLSAAASAGRADAGQRQLQVELRVLARLPRIQTAQTAKAQTVKTRQ